MSNDSEIKIAAARQVVCRQKKIDFQLLSEETYSVSCCSQTDDACTMKSDHRCSYAMEKSLITTQCYMNIQFEFCGIEF